jgi:hypothetical protein
MKLSHACQIKKTTMTLITTVVLDFRIFGYCGYLRLQLSFALVILS